MYKCEFAIFPFLNLCPQAKQNVNIWKRKKWQQNRLSIVCIGTGSDARSKKDLILKETLVPFNFPNFGTGFSTNLAPFPMFWYFSTNPYERANKSSSDCE